MARGRIAIFAAILQVWACGNNTSTRDLLNGNFSFALAAAPNAFTVLTGGTQQVTALGGVKPYSYKIYAGSGSISASGLFTAGNPGVVLIHIRDGAGATAFVQGTVQVIAKDPNDFPGLQSSLKLWLKADALSLAHGALVSTWADSSGNHFDASGSGGNRPGFVAQAYNGKPAIRFSSPNVNSGPTNQYLSIATMPNLDGDAVTAFVVATASANINAFIMRGNGTNGSPGFTSQYSQRAYEYGFNEGGPVDRYIMQNSASGLNLCTYVQAANRSAQSFFNGAQQQDANAVNSLVGYRFTSLGGLPAYAAEYPYNGDIAEVIVYYAALNVMDRAAIDCYLMIKYGIANNVCSAG